MLEYYIGYLKWKLGLAEKIPEKQIEFDIGKIVDQKEGRISGKL